MKSAVIPILLLLLIAPDLGAADKNPFGSHGKGDEDALRVIDEKCLVCHNHKRIDKAMRERKDMEAIQRAMEKKGAVLTDKERSVMGHFWKKNPFRQ